MQNSKKDNILKKVIIIGFAFIASILIVELFINNVIGYPKYTGRDKFILNMNLPNYEFLNWKKPGYKTWTVEGGNNVYKLNNMGLPGSDIKVDSFSKFVYLLGDSFLEGEQYPGDKIASSIFQKELALDYPNYEILNLGISGHDPYILWFRAHFFEKYFRPDYVILVIEDYKRLDYYLNRFKNNYNFNIPDNLGVHVSDSFITGFINFIRKQSAFSNLITESYFLSKNGQNSLSDVDESSNDTAEKLNRNRTNILDTVPSLLKESLMNFQMKYKNKFVFVSLDPDTLKNNNLNRFCTSKNIIFFHNDNIMKSENLINGIGHFNLHGNLLLGQYLFEIFKDVCSKNNDTINSKNFRR